MIIEMYTWGSASVERRHGESYDNRHVSSEVDGQNTEHEISCMLGFIENVDQCTISNGYRDSHIKDAILDFS